MPTALWSSDSLLSLPTKPVFGLGGVILGSNMRA
jgi:hypothetical protein